MVVVQVAMRFLLTLEVVEVVVEELKWKMKYEWRLVLSSSMRGGNEVGGIKDRQLHGPGLCT